MPERFLSRTIQQVLVTQGAAGATDLVAIPGAGFKIYVVSYCIKFDAAGSYKFTEGTGPTDLTGLMPVAINEFDVVAADGLEPILQTQTANSKLTIATTTAKAFGWLRYYISSD